MKYLISLILVFALGFGIYKGIDFYTLQQRQAEEKEYLAEINRINYGLFNLQIWKEKAMSIFEGNLSQLELPQSTYIEIEDELQRNMREIYDAYFKSGKIVKDFLKKAEQEGKVNKVFARIISENIGKTLEHFDLEGQLPYVSGQIMKEIKLREPQMKALLVKGITNVINDTSDNPYIDPRASIYKFFDKSSLEETTIHLKASIKNRELQLNADIKILYGVLLGVAILSLLLSSIMGSKLSIGITSLASIVMLILGVLMPMIDIDARLNAFTMQILDKPISFDEQFLYYQSKSILDVTQTMIGFGKWDMKLVGILVLCFSVIVPLIKLCLTGLLVMSEKLRKSATVKGIVYHLGKWSMADVFVVAMFMAYIGFEGILTSQLQSIERNSNGFAVETLNYSTLSYGALFFTTYCILSIISGIMVKRYDDKLNKLDV